MVAQNIDVPKDRIADFCRRHHIRKMSLFGSVLRETDRIAMDVLVEFEPGHTPGLAFFGMQDEFGIARSTR